MKHLKIVLLEDCAFDVALIERELSKAGISFTAQVVCEKQAFENALKAFMPDVILCDHNMPKMNSIEAFQVFREHQKQANQLIPFILVTGEVSEEFAVQCIKGGIDDYILKDRLKRLPLSIANALEKCRLENERMQYLRQVVRNEAMMKVAEHLALLGSWEADLITGQHSWSDETFRMIGYEPGEIVPGFESFYDIVHPDDLERIKENYSRVIDGAPEGASDFRIIDKKGNLKYISGKIQVDRDEHNRPVRIAGFILDVTERKKAELALQKSEQEYKSLFEQNPEAVFSIDPQGRFTNVNERLVAMIGLSAAQLRNQHFRPFVHEDDLAGVLDHFAAALERKPQRFVARVVGKGGTIYTLDVANMPIVVNNEVVGVHGMASDITDKRELENLLDQAYRHARIGGWEVNLESRKVSWTAVIRKIMEVDGDMEFDLPATYLFFKEGKDRQSIIAAVENGISRGRPWDLVVRAVTARGNERWVRAMGEAEMKDGKCIRLRGTLQDVHQRKVAEETLSKTLLEKDDIMENMRDGFIALDRKWTITYWNNRAETVMGIPRADILGKNVWEFFEESKSLIFFTEACRAMEEGVPVHFEGLYPPLNVWLDVNIYPTDSGLAVYFKDFLPGN